MKLLQKIVLLCFFIFSISSSASADGLKGDVSLGIGTGRGGTSTTTGSNMFAGTAKTNGGMEITGSIKPFDPLPNLFAYARLSSKSHEHKASFVGADIGGQKCDGFVGGGGGWDFTPDSPINVKISGGFEHYQCSGRYALGGAALTQTDMPSTIGAVETEVSGSLGYFSDHLKKSYLGFYARYTGEMKSSVTPVAGNKVTNRTGGDAQAGILGRVTF